jgi:HTH-type transcriptional regulator/antitoxin HipB
MQVHTVQDLGAAVREARVKRHMTQADLARQAGVSRDWLVRLEQGHPRLEAQLVLDTLSAAGVTLSTSDSPSADQTVATWNKVFADLAVEPAHKSPTAELTPDPPEKRQRNDG